MWQDFDQSIFGIVAAFLTFFLGIVLIGSLL